MTRSKRALALAVVLVTTGCYIDFKRPGRPQVVPKTFQGREHRQAGDNALGDGFGPKVVEGKQRPTRLIARDGTSCTVSQKKFDSTIPGSSVWCTWFDTNR